VHSVQSFTLVAATATMIEETPAGRHPAPSLNGSSSELSAATPTPQGRPVITIMHRA
jgi:hypothetical protein